VDRERDNRILDEDLVAAAAYGDLRAFDELVRRYRYAVTMVAKDITGSSELADDVAQDAFLTAYKALPQLNDPSKFASWLYTIARNRARRVGQGEKNHVPLSVIDEFIVSKSPELSRTEFEKVDAKLTCARLAAEMESIPKEYADAMQLYYSQEWPVERIASFFSLPQTTVKWRLHQGRELLRKRLGED